MLACPHCQGRLRRVQSAENHFWTCDSCGGRLVDLGLLRRRAPAALVDELWKAAQEDEGTQKRPCPVCKGPMALVARPIGSVAVALDVCLQCKMVWFDPEEYDRLRRAASPPKERKAAGGKEPYLEEKWKWVPAVLGMPVERERSKLRSSPWATWALVAAISAISCAAFLDLRTVIANFGLIPAAWWRYGGLTLLTSFFLHSGFYHLFGNMYFLLVFGDNVEDYVGKRRFLLLVLLAALGGDLVHMVLEPRSELPSIGASGGISGVVAFYALQFPQAKLLVLVRQFFFWPLRITARTGLLLWLLFQLLGAWLQLKGITNISSLAHLGGTGVGALFWVAGRKP